MRFTVCITVLVMAALLPVCIGCGQKSGEQLQQAIDDGKFNQEEVLQALESESEYRRQVAAEFLAKLGDKAVVKPLIKHMHTDASVKVRKICLNGLLLRAKEKGPGADAETLIPEFITMLKAEDTNLRQKAIFALGEMRNDDGYKAILEMLKDKAAEVRVEAVKALAKFEKKEALAELVKLYDDEASVRRVAVETIAKIGGPDSVDLLIPALENDDYTVKRIAVDELGRMKARKAAPKIVPLLEADNSSLREAAANALGIMRERTAIKPLIKLIKDPILDVRRAAVKALVSIGGIEELDELIALLDDGDNKVREYALDGLVQMKAQSEALKAKLRYMATSDPYTDLREKAKVALDAMK